MLSRILLCIPLVFVTAALCGAQVPQPAPAEVEDEIEALKAENADLKSQLNALEAKVDEMPLDLYRSLRPDDDLIRSGFIQKGGITGSMDKLLNVNLFLGSRYAAIKNDNAAVNNDVDGFSIPFARLHLTGQAMADVYYTASFEFTNFNDSWIYQYPGLNDDNVYEAALTWRPSYVSENCPFVENFEITAGLTRTFLSPAGMEEPWQLDFIEYPLIVYRLLPPGLNRDKGAYLRTDLIEGGRVKFWAGLWNGAHRQLPMDGTGFQAVTAYDAWGNGQDNDRLGFMSRLQVDVLDEDEYFLMFSGGVSRNRLTFTEIPVGGFLPVRTETRTDRILNVASELRFNDHNTWAKAEFMHAYVHGVQAPTERGYYVAVGHMLAPFLENLEVAARYEGIKVNDGMHAGNDLNYFTAGLNFYFDPEQKNDAKVQLNYMIRKERGPDITDNALLLQFVLGF